MKIEDRRYQRNTAELLRNKRRSKYAFRLCLEAPTGSGKRIILVNELREPRRQLVLTHRTILLKQASRELTAWGIPHGIIAPGHKLNLKAPIQLAMTQTLLKRLPKIRAQLDREGQSELFDFEDVHIDELHAQRGPKYLGLYEELYQRGANIIGYSATPANLGGVVDECVRVTTVPELIKQGYLRPPKVFSCGVPDIKLLDKLRRDANGEYVAGDVNKLVKPQIIFGSVVANYKRITNGSPFFLFAHSVKASIWWAQSMTAKGIPTAHIDGGDVWVDGKFYKSDHEKRQECFDRLKDGTEATKKLGRLSGISNRFVLREGVDCPWVGHVILTAPVGSRVSFVQMCGRARAEGYEYYIVQDHSGSCLSHPRLDSVEPWNWQAPAGMAERIHVSSMRNDVIPEPIVCPKCMCQRYAGDTCPHCGHRYAKHCRFVQQVDGTLRLVEGRMYVPQKVKPQPDDAEVWERLFYGNLKNHPNRTPEQIRAGYAYMQSQAGKGWRWLPRNLPLQPKTEAGWFTPVGKIPTCDLRTSADFE